MAQLVLILKFLLYCTIFKLVSTTNNFTFPPGFLLGVSTASYQIEGGWNSNGKGTNVWDTLTHNYPELIDDNSNGDIACDSYNLWEKDIEMLQELGVDHYRFSLSWSRLLPTGFSNVINPDGVLYYDKIINALIHNNIQPMVTLYHWDLPQPLQDLGGWTNLQIATYFEDYARVAFGLFGDRVKLWITINEPPGVCIATYESDDSAPHIKSPGVGSYLCGKTLLIAHAKAYRLYEADFKRSQKGRIGITIDSAWEEPKTNKSEDVKAAERAIQIALGWWTNPIFSSQGDYPTVMKDRISVNSKREHFPRSRLPPFSSDEIKLIQGSFDFLGLNHYHTRYVRNRELPESDPPSLWKDMGVAEDTETQIINWGIRKLLNWIKKEYSNPLVIITENGFPDEGIAQDSERIEYLNEIMKGVLLAIEDGCNVGGYTVWSLMDNMEWRSGYTIKFGLYKVNFDDANRTRTPKDSATFYKNVIKSRILPNIKSGLITVAYI